MMMKGTEENRNKLINTIDEIFVQQEEKEKKSSEKAIINPELTIEKLEEITDNARNIIVSLSYLRGRFAKGVKIFEVIVEKNELEMNKDYLDSLKKDVMIK